MTIDEVIRELDVDSDLEITDVVLRKDDDDEIDVTIQQTLEQIGYREDDIIVLYGTKTNDYAKMMFDAYADNDYHDIDEGWGSGYVWKGSSTPSQTWISHDDYI